MPRIESLRGAVNAILVDNADIKGDLKAIRVDVANIARAIDWLDRMVGQRTAGW
jgi:hypothetical protein